MGGNNEESNNPGEQCQQLLATSNAFSFKNLDFDLEVVDPLQSPKDDQGSNEFVAFVVSPCEEGLCCVCFRIGVVHYCGLDMVGVAVALE